MPRMRHTEEQIIGILKQAEAGVKTADICREHGISAQTFYEWKAKFGGMEVSDARKLLALEDENRQGLQTKAGSRNRKDKAPAQRTGRE